MKKSSFAVRLDLALKDSGLKASDLCRECSISKSTMSQYRSGKYEAKHERIVQMAAILGCSADWLAGEDVPMRPTVADGSGMGTVPRLKMFGLDPTALFADENIEGCEPCDLACCDGHHFVVTACDRGMYPLILEGDSVLCIACDRLEKGQTGVYLLPDGRGIICRSIYEDGVEKMDFVNPFYHRIALSEMPGARVIGRVVRTTRRWDEV